MRDDGSEFHGVVAQRAGRRAVDDCQAGERVRSRPPTMATAANPQARRRVARGMMGAVRRRSTRVLVGVLLGLGLCALGALLWSRTGDAPAPDVPAAATPPPRAANGADDTPAHTTATPRQLAAAPDPDIDADPAGTTGGPLPRVRGRFVFADGAPWPAATVQASPWVVPGAAADAPGAAIAVAADGRFALTVEAVRTDGGRCGYQLFASHPRGTGAVSGELNLSALDPTAGAPVDLGDVVLDHGMALVRGRVVDHDGVPIAGALVLVRAPFGQGTRHVRTTGTPQSLADGTFALFAARDQELPPSGDAGYTVQARTSGYRKAGPIPFAPGARDLELVLERAGAIAGSVRLLRGQRAGDLRVSVTPADETAPVVGRVGDDGAFRFDQLAPGFYAFRAELQNGSGAAAAVAAATDVPQVLVRPGEVTEDPRLQGVVIPALPDRLTLRVVDRDGQPIARATARLAGAGRGGETRADPDGRIALPAPGAPVDLVVEAFGFRPATLRAVDRDQDVVLRPGLAAVLRCRGAPAHAEDPRYDLGLRFYGPLDPTAAPTNRRPMLWPDTTPLDHLFFDADGALRMRFPAPGRYVAEPFVFVQGRDQVGRGGNLTLDPEVVIEVLDVPGEQSIAVEVPRERVEEFARRLVR
ncbi:MAG: hypothetical protein AB7O97_23990 [Planctomycetota bacterium]